MLIGVNTFRYAGSGVEAAEIQLSSDPVSEAYGLLYGVLYGLLYTCSSLLCFLARPAFGRRGVGVLGVSGYLTVLDTGCVVLSSSSRKVFACWVQNFVIAGSMVISPKPSSSGLRHFLGKS